MKKTELKNCPTWLLDANTINEDVDWINGCIVWHNGIWEGGWWKGGTWEGGTWKGGMWRGGTWEGGKWRGGTWEGGWWKGGTWEGGTWKGGMWVSGTWKGIEDRLLYMASMIGIVFDKNGKSKAYRTTNNDNRGRWKSDFIQKPGKQSYCHDKAGTGTCCTGIHVTTMAKAWTYFGVNKNCKMWEVTFNRQQLLDCDGEKARISGGFFREIEVPFIKSEV